MADQETLSSMHGSALTLGTGTYRRLFPRLRRVCGDNDFLLSLGTEGGICDGTGAGAVAGQAGQDDSQVPAGWPFFGQFIAHDITADRSPLKTEAEVTNLRNVRAPLANLECLYGEG